MDLQSLRQGGGREAWALGGVQTLDSYVVDCEAESFVVATEEGDTRAVNLDVECTRSRPPRKGEEARTGLIASTSTPCCCSSWLGRSSWVFRVGVRSGRFGEVM